MNRTLRVWNPDSELQESCYELQAQNRFRIFYNYRQVILLQLIKSKIKLNLCLENEKEARTILQFSSQALVFVAAILQNHFVFLGFSAFHKHLPFTYVL